MDLLSDFICRINQVIVLKKLEVKVVKTTFILEILNSFEEFGFIRGYKILPNSNEILVLLKYVNGVSILSKLVRISKRSKKVYNSNYQGKTYGFSYLVISSNEGILITSSFKKIPIGGENLMVIK
jgi:ribosomal protein S8